MKGIEVPLDHQRICPSYGTPPGGNPAPQYPPQPAPPVPSPPAQNTPKPWGSPDTDPSTNNYPSGYGQGHGHSYGNGYPPAGAPAAPAPAVIDSEYHYGGKTNHIESSDVNIGDDAVAVTADSERDVCYS